jgi:hypothetical protein
MSTCSVSEILFVIIILNYQGVVFCLLIDAYKVARKCNGESFCLDVPPDKVIIIDIYLQ